MDYVRSHQQLPRKALINARAADYARLLIDLHIQNCGAAAQHLEGLDVIPKCFA